MDRDAVVFKGTRDGLMILLKDGLPFETLKASLIERLESGRSFFEGSRTQLRVAGNLNDTQAEEITRIMREEYGLFEVQIERRSMLKSTALSHGTDLQKRGDERMQRYRDKEWERDKEYQKQQARERLERERFEREQLLRERQEREAYEREQREKEAAAERERILKAERELREREVREAANAREPRDIRERFERDRERNAARLERQREIERQREAEAKQEAEAKRETELLARENERRRDMAREELPLRPSDLAPGEEKGDVWSRPERETMAMFVHHTVRSGQRITYPGDIVVLGDVNPGAELVAGGNIVVMGQMRGMAHAGALGEERAVVTAFILQPMQLRIAGHIGRAPDDGTLPAYPEQARIENGAIMIEPYAPSKR